MLVDILAPFIYVFCIALKCGALFYAVSAWALLSDEFADPKGHIKNTRTSRMERLFQSTLLGTIANMMFLPAIAFYIVFYDGYTLGWIEMLFLGGHMFDSAYSLSTHHHTYREAQRNVEANHAR